jgi:hypothetical protein
MLINNQWSKGIFGPKAFKSIIVMAKLLVPLGAFSQVSCGDLFAPEQPPEPLPKLSAPNTVVISALYKVKGFVVLSLSFSHATNVNVAMANKPKIIFFISLNY